VVDALVDNPTRGLRRGWPRVPCGPSPPGPEEHRLVAPSRRCTPACADDRSALDESHATEEGRSRCCTPRSAEAAIPPVTLCGEAGCARPHARSRPQRRHRRRASEGADRRGRGRWSSGFLRGVLGRGPRRARRSNLLDPREAKAGRAIAGNRWSVLEREVAASPMTRTAEDASVGGLRTSSGGERWAGGGGQ